MKRVCVWCPTHHEYGQTAPLEDLRSTHGMCAVAAALADTMLDELFVGADAPVEPLFFTQHVVETSPIVDRRVTMPNLPQIRPEWPKPSTEPGA